MSPGGTHRCPRKLMFTLSSARSRKLVVYSWQCSSAQKIGKEVDATWFYVNFKQCRWCWITLKTSVTTSCKLENTQTHKRMRDSGNGISSDMRQHCHRCICICQRITWIRVYMLGKKLISCKYSIIWILGGNAIPPLFSINCRVFLHSTPAHSSS